MVVGTPLARPPDADGPLETQSSEQLGLEHHGGRFEPALAKRPRHRRAVREALDAERPARRAGDGGTQQGACADDVGIEPVIAEQQAVRDRGLAVAHPLRADLALKGETPEPNRGRHAAVEGRAVDTLRDLGEHAAAALDVPPAEVEMEAGTDVADGLRDVGNDAAVVGELPVPVDDDGARATAPASARMRFIQTSAPASPPTTRSER